MKKNLNKKGFTIVELVIVIAVIAILAAVLIPTFSNVITSANKSANLSEAQSTLKSYDAFMASNGQELSDGPVFQVVDGDEVKATYVFYKGNLHEFTLTEKLEDFTSEQKEAQKDIVSTTVGPLLSIGNKSYACNKSFQLLDGNGDIYKINGDDVTFYYSDQEPVKFEDGSLKCKIYPGCIRVEGQNFTSYAMVSTDIEGATLETTYIPCKFTGSLSAEIVIKVKTTDDGKFIVKIGENSVASSNVTATYVDNGDVRTITFELNSIIGDISNIITVEKAPSGVTENIITATTGA